MSQAKKLYDITGTLWAGGAMFTTEGVPSAVWAEVNARLTVEIRLVA